ncbi:MAG: GNAT family N-acetyltransferase [Magnetococcus sp. DMHC-8]
MPGTCSSGGLSLPTVHMQPAMPAEYPAVIQLLQQAAQALHARGVSQWPPAWLSSQRQLIARQVDQGQVWTARLPGANQTLAGIVTVQEQAEIFWGVVREPTLFFQKLARHPEAGYAGIGDRILCWLEQEARQRACLWLRLECLASNTALHRYYETRGFTQTGHAIDQDTPLLLYQKRIQPQG